VADRSQGRRWTADLAFNLALALVSELVVQVTGWSRLPVLIVVFAVGHVLAALTRSWLRGRPRRSEASPRVAEHLDGR
jgi:hypothetical protein